MSESIYGIVPKDDNPPPKPPIYKSKYPPNIPPTGTTFGIHTTSKPMGANLNGDFHHGLEAHTQYGGTKTFGHLKGDRKPNPEAFLKKQTGTMGNQTLPPVRNFSYDSARKKDPVPLAKERPIHGLKTNKNFITQNAIENILSTSKKPKEEENWLKKKDFGKNPEYLNKIKENVTNEYKMIQTLHEESQHKVPYLSEEEVNDIREGLKRKWNEVNHEYQKLTHNRVVDTIGMKRRKETCEKQLAEIERDIKKLNKTYVFIDQ